MPRKHGCQAPWRPAQVASLLVWFSTVAGFYALFLPVLPSAAWQAATGALYSMAAAAIFCTYFMVSLTDPADDSTDGPLYCDHCQAYVQRGSRHCKECQKCVLGFDHHCKWINNCIGRKNYRTFLALLTAMCALLAVQLAAGIDDLLECFKAADVMTARIQAAYPVPMSLQSYIAALCVYLAVVLLALYGLGDLWLLHLVLLARGLTTYDYIMANHDAAVAASAAAPVGSQAPQHSVVAQLSKRLRLLGPRSSKVMDSSVLEAAADGTGSSSNGDSGSSSSSNGTSAHMSSSISRRPDLRLSIAQSIKKPKHRVSLTPCQACLTPRSAVEARKHAIAYQDCNTQSPKADSMLALSPRLPAKAAPAAAGDETGTAQGAAAFDAAAQCNTVGGSGAHAGQQQGQGQLQQQQSRASLLQYQQQGQQGLSQQGQQQQPQHVPQTQDPRGPLWPALQQSGWERAAAVSSNCSQQQHQPSPSQAAPQALHQPSGRRSRVSFEAAAETGGPCTAGDGAALGAAAAAPASPRGVLRHTTSNHAGGRSLPGSHRPSVKFAAE